MQRLSGIYHKGLITNMRDSQLVDKTRLSEENWLILLLREMVNYETCNEELNQFSSDCIIVIRYHKCISELL